MKFWLRGNIAAATVFVGLIALWETVCRLAKVPVWLSGTPGGIRRRAPTLGEHTDQIMGTLGYDAAAIAALRKKGVI